MSVRLFVRHTERIYHRVHGFTKYVVLKAVRNTSPVIQMLNEVFAVLGKARRIVIDRWNSLYLQGIRNTLTSHDVLEGELVLVEKDPQATGFD